MQLDLDPEHIRTQMRLRRAATDMKLPMDEKLKLHFITQRGPMLSNCSITAGSWMMLLHGCCAEGEQKAHLEALKREILEFKEWAEDGMQELQRLGLQEAVESDAVMPDDARLVASMRKLLGIPHPKDPRDRTRD